MPRHIIIEMLKLKTNQKSRKYSDRNYAGFIEEHQFELQQISHQSYGEQKEVAQYFSSAKTKL